MYTAQLNNCVKDTYIGLNNNNIAVYLICSLIFRSTIIHTKASGGGVPAHAEGERGAGQRGLQQSVDHQVSRSADHIITYYHYAVHMSDPIV